MFDTYRIRLDGKMSTKYVSNIFLIFELTVGPLFPASPTDPLSPLAPGFPVDPSGPDNPLSPDRPWC